MPDHRAERRRAQAREQAAAWLVRLDGGGLPPADQARFDAWVAADPDHALAYAEVVLLWSELDGVAAERKPGARPVASVAPSGATPGFPAGRPRRSRLWPALGAAAAVAALLAVLGVGTDLGARWQADARTGVGEIATVALPDGSTAVLNTDSALTVEYAADERRVRLLRGEAAFTAAAEPSRPFRVAAAGGVSTALGTAFLVRERDGGASVTVLESRVAVAREGSPDAHAAATLKAGQRIAYTADGRLGPVEAVDAEAAAAWRRGKLVFVDQPLGEVVAELNRYHLGRIAIWDAGLGALRVSGVFETREPVAVVDALEAALGLRSTRLSGLLILLHL